MKKIVLFILVFVFLLSSAVFAGPTFAKTKYTVTETYNILKEKFPEFIDRLKTRGVTDDEIAAFLYDLNENLSNVKGLNKDNFKSNMFTALKTTLYSGAHNNLLSALMLEFSDEIEAMLTTHEIPPELQPLYDTVLYCVLGDDGNNTGTDSSGKTSSGAGSSGKTSAETKPDETTAGQETPPVSKYSISETYNVLKIMFPEFIEKLKKYNVTDDEIASFLSDLIGRINGVEGLNKANFQSGMLSALQTTLYSGAHNNLLGAMISEYYTEIETMLTTRKIPPEMQPLYDTVLYCVLGEGDIQLFNDVDNSHWAKKYIEELAVKGVISGVGDHLYDPEASVTREQFTKMIVDAMGYEKSDIPLPFTDTNSNEWYYSYVAAAYENSLIAGVGDNMFGTGEKITRQDMAVILYRAAGRKGLEFTASDTVFNTFADKGEIDAYAADAVRLLSGSGIINGYAGMFSPKDFLTRAEAARVIYALFYEYVSK